MGFLDILETARGLGSPQASEVLRVGAWQAALEKLDGPPLFWTRSLNVDGWASARTLLRWRDELVAAGWRASEEWDCPRLADFAVAERAADHVPLGTADRIAALVDDLAQRQALPITRLRLIDRLEDHPAGWRRLIDRVQSCGVRVEQIEHRPAASVDTALGRLQRWIVAGGEIGGAADGTVTVATAASAALAAEVTGQWFAERIPDDAVLVAEDGDTQLLDHALAGAGQPRAGRSLASAHRGSLQALLLGFKTAWMPFDPHALMELLVFPSSPVAPRAARRLADALEQAPGRGSAKWLDAWTRISAAEIAAAHGDPSLIRKAEARIARWRAWADPALSDPETGMPIEAALAICDRTVQWATVRHAADGDPLHHAAARLAGDLRAALIALGRAHLPRTLVERVIDQALDVGHADPSAIAEAADWRSVAHPGAIWRAIGDLVWWNFRVPEGVARRQPWSQAERDELIARGCPLDDAGREGRAASAAWERAILHAREHVLFVTGGLDAGDEEAAHPLAHRLAPAMRRLATHVRLDAALTSPSLALAGATAPRRAVAVEPPPEATPSWRTPATWGERLADRTQSATSLESLLSCQLMWALKHVAFLRPGRTRAIPDANRLHGNLAHALAQAIFQPGQPPTPEAAAASVRSLIERQIDELAAPLRLPELAAALSEAQARLPGAMAALAATLAENCLTVEAVESETQSAFGDGLSVRGVIDMIARDPDGARVIVDLKWTRGPKGRLDELAKGQAVQLATYGALLGDAAGTRAGYFLLRQRQFATVAGCGLRGRPVDGPNFGATWAALRESWRLLGRAAAAGEIVAGGVEGASDHLPAALPLRRDADCRRCDYQTLCRVKDAQ